MRPQTVHFLLTMALAAAVPGRAAAGESVGGVILGEAKAGITDAVYVLAPPDYAYVMTRSAGSFLDCGEGASLRAVDADGRDAADLLCGVTLTETVATPKVGASARLYVHY
ncbi:MAG: hypothetical protein AAFV51_10805 [Pseudomonadota bacterium]